MNRHVAGASALAAVLTLGACGTTYVETTATTAPEAAATTTLAPVDPDTPVAELLAEIETVWVGLDQRIIDQDDHVATFERIAELWAAAERQIRDDDPDDLFNFEQAIELARSGVDRLRPADASKGYKIFTGVTDAYLAET